MLTKSTANKSKKIIPTALTIAGSDPTGGAGIQADIKTMTRLGVYAASAITAVTVQNSKGVSRVMPLPPDLVREQILAVLDDHHVSHIKIGMVGTMEIARTIAETLAKFSGEVILDPVMISTTGQNLFDSVHNYAPELLEVTTVLTPNLPELAILADEEVDTTAKSMRAATVLLGKLPRLRAVLIKGGHEEGQFQITDRLLMNDEGEIKLITRPHLRINTTNCHGTGCTLASAFTAFHLRDWHYGTAFRNSVQYMDKILKQSADAVVTKSPSPNGPMLHHLT
ncbi:MAG: bifunctional hydroxymethylpyrimidine kinase/phosphomethylpyrimidine kinase [Desulfobulbaceae bacterium]|nr:bifunctional hydroxymethylpyrimidine kinase/phosphomethylpyrimidine kinase [Desulfobulbaceae bacterium]